MTLPGVDTQISEPPPRRFAPESPANAMIVGFAERGAANTPILVTSLPGATSLLGGRLIDSPLHDALDVYFREGGRYVYVSRQVGPAAAASTGVLLDATPTTPGNSLIVTAASPGAWGDGLDLVVTVAGATFTIEVSLDGQVVSTSPALSSNSEAVAWAANSAYIRLADGGGGTPAAATVSLAGGTDDRANAGDTEFAAALAAFTRDYGPGQVAAPGYTTAAAHQSLLAHASQFGRNAVLDAANTATASDLAAAAVALRAVPGNRGSGLFAPWDVCPGLSVGTTRTVPPSARNLALFARSLASGGTPGDPAAGSKLPSRYVTGLSQPAWSDENRELLNDAGVNVSIVEREEVIAYGNRTLTSAVLDPNHAQLSQARVIAAIASEANKIGGRYVLSKVDGGGINVGEFAGELNGLCLRYFREGDLYGASPEDAFEVVPSAEIGDASAKVIATIYATTSPGADRVEISIVKTPTNS